MLPLALILCSIEGHRFNYDERPHFGREWAGDEDTGMVVLQPGQSVEWKIRPGDPGPRGTETDRL